MFVAAVSRRLPEHAKQDDIDRLVRVVNSMLDEIERLMHEVKGVCDAIAATGPDQVKALLTTRSPFPTANAFSSGTRQSENTTELF